MINQVKVPQPVVSVFARAGPHRISTPIPRPVRNRCPNLPLFFFFFFNSFTFWEWISSTGLNETSKFPAFHTPRSSSSGPRYKALIKIFGAKLCALHFSLHSLCLSLPASRWEIYVCRSHWTDQKSHFRLRLRPRLRGSSLPELALKRAIFTWGAVLENSRLSLDSVGFWCFVDDFDRVRSWSQGEGERRRCRLTIWKFQGDWIDWSKQRKFQGGVCN